MPDAVQIDIAEARRRKAIESVYLESMRACEEHYNISVKLLVAELHVKRVIAKSIRDIALRGKCDP